DSSVTTPETQDPPCSADIRACCALQVLKCIFANPKDCPFIPSTPGISAPGRETGPVARVANAAEGLVLYYRMRDEVFERTPGGRRLNALYYRHSSEIRSLLLSSKALREAGWIALSAWTPTLQDLVAGDAEKPISQGQVDRMLSFLGALASKASPDLRIAIERETASLGLASFAGLTATEALARLDHFSCGETDTALCLNGGRFRVEASWTD